MWMSGMFMLNVMYDLEYDRDACWIWLIFMSWIRMWVVECDRYPWMWSNLNSWILHHLAFHRGAGEREGNSSSSSGSNTVLWLIDLETSLFRQIVSDVICRKLEQAVRKKGRDSVASFLPHFSREAFHGLSSPEKCSAFGFSQNP